MSRCGGRVLKGFERDFSECTEAMKSFIIDEFNDAEEEKRAKEEKCEQLFFESIGENVTSETIRGSVNPPDELAQPLESIPLETPWTFWVDRTQPGVGIQEFEANLKRIHTFYTVQTFWTVYRHMPQPSALQVRSSMHLTRFERKPIWEEKYNCKGGTFRLRVPKKYTDEVWRELLMAAVGEQFEFYISPKDDICGISVSVREREDILLIWMANAEEADNATIYEFVQQLCPDTKFLAHFFKPHKNHHAFEKPKEISAQESPSSRESASRRTSSS